MATLEPDDPSAKALLNAIHAGDVESLTRLLTENPHLISAIINGRTLLSIATDWPGHFPNVGSVIRALIAAGADPNDPMYEAKQDEAPLHWAASSDDVEALDALLDAAANIEAPYASIAGGSPLDDAVGYGQWNAARRLVERGARVQLWHAAALGIMPVIEQSFQGSQIPTRDEVNAAFWQACHGGQRAAAEYILEKGAELNWVAPWGKQTPLDIARDSCSDDLIEWLISKDSHSAREES